MNDQNLVDYLQNRKSDLENQIKDYEQRIATARSAGDVLDDTSLAWLQARSSEIDRLFAYLDIQKRGK